MDQSPLNKLPAELRDYIYHLALVQDERIILGIRIRPDPDDDRLRIQKEPEQKHVLGLSSTCKQIRAECLPVFYKRNHFQTAYFGDCFRDLDENEIAVLGAWKTSLGEWSPCLKSLEVGWFVPAEDVGFEEGDKRYWSSALNKLRDTFDLPKLLLTVVIDGVSGDSGVYGYELEFRIVGRRTDQALAQFQRDFEQMESRVESEVSDDFEGQVVMEEFEAMKRGVEYIVSKY